MNLPKKRKYGRWILLKYTGMTPYFHHLYTARCKCGTIKIVRLCNLKSGRSKGCIKCSLKRAQRGFKKWMDSKK